MKPLEISNPNAKNTGVAAQFELFWPVGGSGNAHFIVRLAKQKTVADNNGHEATFDWDNPIVVAFNKPIEIAEIIMVFGGQVMSLTHNGREGIFHDDPESTTSVALKRAEDPSKPGFLLGVGRTPKADPNARRYISFYISPAEAFMLRAALMAEMGAICFG